jgi:hypothetical protein
VLVGNKVIFSEILKNLRRIVLNGMFFEGRNNLREVGLYGNTMLKTILGKEL